MTVTNLLCFSLADQVGYGPERATTAAVGFLQGIHPVAVAASGNSTADADADSTRAPPNAHELQPPKASRALFELKSEPAELERATATASANGERSSATLIAAATAPSAPPACACPRASPPPPARVLKDVVCFHAACYRQVSELLQLDLHEPPASQVRALRDP